MNEGLNQDKSGEINPKDIAEDDRKNQEVAGKKEEVQADILDPKDEKKEPDKAQKDPVENDKDGKKIERAYVVTTEDMNKEIARTYAEKNINERQNAKGFKSLFDRVKLRVFEEVEKQRLIAKYQKQINSGEFEGKIDFEAEKKAAAEILVRKAEKEAADEELNKGTDGLLRYGETKDSEIDEKFNENVKELIKEYVSSEDMKKEDFEKQKEELINKAFAGDRSKLFKKENVVDNLFEIAEGIKQSSDLEKALAEMDNDFSIIIGKARSGLRTEAELSGFDKFIQKVQESRLSAIIEPATIGIVAASIYSLANFGAQRATRSVLANISTMGAAGIFGVAYGSARRNKELKMDFAMHQREMATGGKIEKDSNRRNKMEEFRVETRSAKSSISELDKLMGAEVFGPDQYKAAREILIDLKARIEAGDEKNVDLISYSGILEVQRERNELDIKIAEAELFLEGEDKVSLREGDENISEAINNRKASLVKEKDSKAKLFNKYKNIEVVKAGAKGAAVGLIVGAVVFEAYDLYKDYIAPLGLANSEAIAINGNDQVSFKLPRGVEIGYDENGACQLIQGKEVIVDNVSFNPDGTLSSETEQMMGNAGIIVEGGDVPIDGSSKQSVLTDSECAGRSEFERIYRDGWDDNNTPMHQGADGKWHGADLNETRLVMGGVSGTGIDSEGNYVLDVSQMTRGGSFHEGFSDDYAEALKNKTLKLNLSLSEDTQRHVVSVDFNEDGQAIIKKDSTVAQMFFENKDGHAVFKGRFAEVAHIVGEKTDGDVVRILATAEGVGVEGATIIEPSEIIGHDYTLIMPENFSPIPIPVVPFARDPLEKLGKDKETEPIAGQKGEESDEDSGEKGKKRELPYTNKLENLEALKTNITDRVNQYISKEDILGIGGGFAEFIKITGLKTEDYDIKDGSFKLLYAKRLHDILQNEEVGQALESFFGKRKKIPEIKKANNSGPEVGKTLGLGISKRINENLPAEDILENKGSFAEFVGITGLEENKDYIVENGKFKLLHEVRLRRFLQDKNNRNKIQEFFDKLKKTS
jgi:hypothetical protein